MRGMCMSVCPTRVSTGVAAWSALLGYPATTVTVSSPTRAPTASWTPAAVQLPHAGMVLHVYRLSLQSLVGSKLVCYQFIKFNDKFILHGLLNF